MAMMKYREKNMAKWVGVRPGHNGEQITGNGHAANNTVLLYTVPADKVLLIHHYNFGVRGTAIAVYSSMFIRDELDAFYAFICEGALGVDGHLNNTGDCYFPIEAIAGYDVCIDSTNAAAVTWGSFIGVLVDA